MKMRKLKEKMIKKLRVRMKVKMMIEHIKLKHSKIKAKCLQKIKKSSRKQKIDKKIIYQQLNIVNSLDINKEGIEDLFKKKDEVDSICKKMEKSSDARGLSIYLPNEISPETLFGKSNSELTQEKADLLSSINLSINEHK